MRKIAMVCLTMVLTSKTLLAQVPQSFTVGQIIAEGGQKTSGYLDVPAGVDEGTRIPITVLHGSETGPVLALILTQILVAADRKLAVATVRRPRY